MRIAAAFAVLLAACGTPPRSLGDVEQHGRRLLSGDGELLEECWHSVRLNGSKLGHVQEVRRLVDGLLRIETLTQVWTAAEAPRPAFLDHLLFEETPDGRPVRFSVHSRSPLGAVDLEARIREGRIDVADGTSHPLPADLLFPVALEAHFRRGGDVAYASLDMSSGKPFAVTARREADEGDLVRYSVESTLMPAAKMKEWRTREGRVVRSEFEFGLRIEQELSTREAAVWLESRYLVPRGRLGDARKVRRARFRITVKEGEVDPAAFAFDGQTVDKVDGRHLTLRVDPFHPDAPADERGAPLEEDPAIAAAAREAVGEERNAWKAARLIERWVHGRIRYSPMVLLTAKEVLERGEGDCSESALLAAAMCRAAGIDARVSTGLAAAGRIFGDHAWTEVRVGRWAGIDATMGGPFFDATHIRMAPEVNSRNLEIEVLETEER